MDNKYGPMRCKLARKPSGTLASPFFFRCGTCGRVLHEFRDAGAEAPLCCGQPMEALAAKPAPPGFGYEVAGGFNNNAVLASWPADPPAWILLQTFTGACLKLLPPGKKKPVVFPLADEDAYAYCGRLQCRKCLYNCKKGCVLYFYMGDRSLYFLPLDEIDEYFSV